MRARFASLAAMVGAALLSAGPAAAHHPMGGVTPATFLQGLLSGFGHPIIGLDHLAFLIAVGLAVGLGRLPLATPAAFVLASGAGVALHVAGIGLPAGEFLVAASVVALGVALAAGARLALPPALLLFALAGVLHGHAYGEAVFGAEATPIVAYLLGLFIVQGALASGVAIAAGRARRLGTRLAARLAGGAVATVGLVFLALPAFAV